MIELVQAAPLVKEHESDECVARVAASPTACERVLQAMTRQARTSDLRGDTKWEGAITALLSLADAVLIPSVRSPGSCAEPRATTVSELRTDG